MTTNLKLTPSGRYYTKQEGEFTRFFDLDKNPIPLASATCGECGEIIESKRYGDFVQCKCHASFVDTDRWFPEGHRYGGAAKPTNPDLNEALFKAASLRKRLTNEKTKRKSS